MKTLGTRDYIEYAIPCICIIAILGHAKQPLAASEYHYINAQNRFLDR